MRHLLILNKGRIKKFRKLMLKRKSTWIVIAGIILVVIVVGAISQPELVPYTVDFSSPLPDENCAKVIVFIDVPQGAKDVDVAYTVDQLAEQMFPDGWDEIQIRAWSGTRKRVDQIYGECK